MLLNRETNTLDTPRVQPTASLFSLSKLINLSSWFRSKSNIIMTNKESSVLKNDYLRESGRSFNSRDVGGESGSKQKKSSIQKQSASHQIKIHRIHAHHQ